MLFSNRNTNFHCDIIVTDLKASFKLDKFENYSNVNIAEGSIAAKGKFYFKNEFIYWGFFDKLNNVNLSKEGDFSSISRVYISVQDLYRANTFYNQRISPDQNSFSLALLDLQNLSLKNYKQGNYLKNFLISITNERS